MAVYQWKVQKSNSCSFHTWMSQLLFTIYQNPKEVDPNARENGLASKSEATPAESVNLLLPCPLHVHRRCGSHWRWIFPSQLNWEKKTDTKVIPNDILLYSQIHATQESSEWCYPATDVSRCRDPQPKIRWCSEIKNFMDFKIRIFMFVCFFF